MKQLSNDDKALVTLPKSFCEDVLQSIESTPPRRSKERLYKSPDPVKSIVSPSKRDYSEAGLKRLIDMHTMKVPQETQNAIDRIVWEKLWEENFYNMIPPSTSNEEIKEE